MSEKHIIQIDEETEKHDTTRHLERIDRIFFSQYMKDDADTYVITYNKTHNSIVGWTVDIKNDGKKTPDKFYKLEQLNVPYDIKSFAMYSEKLSLCYCVKKDGKEYYKQCLINLSNKQFFDLEHLSNDDRRYTIGFLPDAKCKRGTDVHLILVSLCDYRIYEYCLDKIPKDFKFKYSKIYDIKIPKSLNEYMLYCSIYKEKLFLFVRNSKTLILQFDLLTMNLDRQYDLPQDYDSRYSSDFRNEFATVIINKDKTLLATEISYSTYIFSMKNGRLISKFSLDGYTSIGSTPVEFVTLNGFERLIIYSKSSGIRNNKLVLIDPRYPFEKHRVYRPYENFLPVKNFYTPDFYVTKSNRKLYISSENNNHVTVTKGFTDNNDNTCRSIYNPTTFTEIQNMLKEFVDEKKFSRETQIKEEFQGGNVIIEQSKQSGIFDTVQFKINNDQPNQPVHFINPYTLSYKRINNNQHLILITVEKIEIYERNEDSVAGIITKYLWDNDEWKETYKKFRDENQSCCKKYIYEHYKQLFKDILNEEFKSNESNSSIPLTRFRITHKDDLVNNLIVGGVTSDTAALAKFISEMSKTKIDKLQMNEIAMGIIKNADLFSEFGSEILKVAIKEKYNNIVKEVIDAIIRSIQINSRNESYHELSDLDQTNYSYMMTLLPIISSNFSQLCKNYPDFVIKYISRTSIILSPYYDSFKSSNTSLYSYSKNVYIKESNPVKKSDPVNNYFKSILSLFKRFIQDLRKQEEAQTISFIVPFPQICVYRETGNNHNDYPIWNKFLYNPKSILFCNIDSNHFYNWWNFAAIIDFKWRTFGWIYYYLIWFLYTVFYICYTIASMLEPNSITDIQRKSLFIISIIFGSIFLIFEIRQFLWNYKFYFSDLWNLLDVGAYSLPIAASICWLINKSQPNWLIAISIILLGLKFLLFFRVFISYGIYFAIILGVAKKVYPFLVVLFFIILGYAQAFFFILRSTNVNNDNDPWNLATRYYFANSDEIINNTTLVQLPNSNTNLFNWFPTSLFAIYKIITGDSGSLSPWTYRENPLMTVLLVTFTFFTVIYLLNLFIGLLNIAIGDYNKEELFLLQKAQIIMEIELFYMWRHDKEWFPDWIYYDMPVTEVRKLINAIDNNKTMFNYYLPVISEDLRKLVALDDDINEEKTNKFKKQINVLHMNLKIQHLQANMKQLQSQNQLRLLVGNQLHELNKQSQQMDEVINSQLYELNQQMDRLNKQMNENEQTDGQNQQTDDQNQSTDGQNQQTDDQDQQTDEEDQQTDGQTGVPYQQTGGLSPWYSGDVY